MGVDGILILIVVDICDCINVNATEADRLLNLEISLSL